MHRCYYKASPSFKNYGARGITVDQRWRGYPEGFKAFIADMGAPPAPELTIERIDNDGPYSPENCRWATRREQSLNSRRPTWITVDGVTQSVTDWARRLGVDQRNLHKRARRRSSDYVTAIRSYATQPQYSYRSFPKKTA